MNLPEATDAPARVFVVNDDTTQLRLLVGLIKRAGHEATPCRSAEEALERMQECERPDLIVTDLHMPEIDGWRFCRLLRSPEYRALNHTPILVTSATFSGEDASQITAELGANAFLPCPVDGREYLETVRALLSGQEPRRSMAALLVEDQEDLLGLLQGGFESHGYRTWVARTGAEARRLFSEHRPEIVVLDYHLPDIEGDSLLGEFREQSPFSVFIMITGDSDPALALNWMKRGASAYARKPFELGYLVALCEKARRERALLGVEAVLEERTRQLRQKEAELQQAQKLEAIGQLAGGVAHDFNNILAALLIQVELLQEESSLGPEVRAGLREVEQNTQRAAALTRQLLAFARRQIMRRQPLDLVPLLANLLSMLRRLIGEHIQLDMQGGVAAAWTFGDRCMLEQVVINLVLNARDAMPKGGRITLCADAAELDARQAAGRAEARAGRFVCLSVADTGSGMDQATLKRLFEPFFTTKELGKGTGLGLATIHGIVKQHEGWIEVESALGQGSSFRIYLPATAPNDARLTLEASPHSTPEVRETILVVEDDASVRQVTVVSLRRSGYRVLEACNGVEALKLWQDHRNAIDLVISDVLMPAGISGVELKERFRQDKPDLPVILVSGYSTELVTQGFAAEGEIAFLQKPFSSAVLARKIRESLENRVKPRNSAELSS